MSGETGFTKSSVQLKQGPQVRLAVWMGLNTSSGNMQVNTALETVGPWERTWPSNLVTLSQDYSCPIPSPVISSQMKIPLNYPCLCTSTQAFRLSFLAFFLSSSSPHLLKKPQISCHYSVITPKGTGTNTAPISPSQEDEEIMSYFQLVSPF